MLVCFGAVVAALAASVHAGPVADIPGAIAITRVAIVDAAAGTITPDATVVVDGDRIARIMADGSGPPAAATVVSGRGKFLIPGLWDMHVHLSYARSSALPVLVANGVTSVRDMGGDLAEIDRWRTQIADGVLVGPAIMRAGPILNGQEFNRFQLTIATASDARMAVRTLKKVGVDLIKMHRRTPRDAFFAVADESRQAGLPFAGHVPMTVTPAEASDAGIASIEHIETLFEGTFLDGVQGSDLAGAIGRWRAGDAAALIDTFRRNGTPIDPTLVAQEYVARLLRDRAPDANARYVAASARAEADRMLADARRAPEAWLQARLPVLEQYRAVTALMHESEVTLLAGTDTSVIHPPGFTLHDELELLVASGLPAAAALRAATSNAARLFPSERVGGIAVGERADLVLLDANPLADIRNARRISGVVVRGRYFGRPALDRLLADAIRSAATQ